MIRYFDQLDVPSMARDAAQKLPPHVRHQLFHQNMYQALAPR